MASFAYILGVLSAFCTAFYSARSLYLTFLAPTNAFRVNLAHAHEPYIFMLLPLFVLALGSICVGYLGKDFFVGLSSTFWGNSLFNGDLLSVNTAYEAEFLPVYIKHIPFILSISGMFISFYFYSTKAFSGLLLLKNKFIMFVFVFFNKKWLFDLIYNNLIVKNVLNVAYKGTFKAIDRGFLEIYGATGLQRNFLSISEMVSKTQSGYIFNYASLMITGIVILLGIYLFADYIVGEFLIIILSVCFIYYFSLRSKKQ